MLGVRGVYSPIVQRDKIHIYIPEQRSSYNDSGRGGEKPIKQGGLGWDPLSR